MMVKAPWVVIDSDKGVMRCDRCGCTHPLTSLEGLNIGIAVGFMEAFVNGHKNCNEIKKMKTLDAATKGG